MMVSSATSLTFEQIHSGISFMYKRKGIGPRTDICGNLDSTLVISNFSPSTTTYCFLSERNFFIRLFAFPLMPCWCNVCSNKLWLTVEWFREVHYQAVSLFHVINIFSDTIMSHHQTRGVEFRMTSVKSGSHVGADI